MLKRKKCIALLMFSLGVASHMPYGVLAATPGEQKIAELELDISQKEDGLEELKKKIRKTEKKIGKQTDELTDLNMELDDMEEKRLKQYEDMKLRIQYLYENNSESIGESLLVSDSTASSAKKSILSSEVHKYDKKKMDEYSSLIQDIEDGQERLEKKISELEGMKKTLSEDKERLNEEIKGNKEELEKLKAEEEERKREEQRRLEEARKKAQEQSAFSAYAPTGAVSRAGNSYVYGEADLQLIYAIVMQECGGSYDGALAVITCACNRAESAKWGYLGSDPLSQLTARGQFCYSLDQYWVKYLGNNVNQCVRDAVTNALNGERNHQFLSFRGRAVVGGVNIGGNYYFSSM